MIRIPPLRERPEDIVDIGIEFVRGYLGDGHEEQLTRIEAWLGSDQAQRYFSAGNDEYPAVPGVALSPSVAALGFFKPDDVSLSAVAAHLPAAQKIFNEVGWEEPRLPVPRGVRPAGARRLSAYNASRRSLRSTRYHSFAARQSGKSRPTSAQKRGKSSSEPRR